MTVHKALGLMAPPNCRPLPTGPRTIADLIKKFSDPDTECIVGLTRRVTYAEILRETDAAAAALLALGLKPGGRLAETGQSDLPLILAFLASQRIRLVWIGMNLALAAPEKTYQVETPEARIVLADATAKDELSTACLEGTPLIALDSDDAHSWTSRIDANADASRPDVEIDPHAPAAIAFTSGTTGPPKGAVHSQHNIMCIANAGHDLIGKGNWQTGLRRGVPLPLTILNIMIYGVVDAVAEGGTFVCSPRNDITSITDRIVTEKVETLGLAPAQFYDLVILPDLQTGPLGLLKYVWCGGSYVSSEIKAVFRQIYGCEVVEDYGLTEALTSIVASRSDEAPPEGAAGRPHPHLDVRAVAPDAPTYPRAKSGKSGSGRPTPGSGPGSIPRCWGTGATPKTRRKRSAMVG